jgi:zinc transport system permease protein
VSEFVGAVTRYDFLQNALIAGMLASVVCGVVGTFVVTRRISYIAGGIAHSVLGGIGVVHYLNVAHGWTVLTPLHGAIIAAVTAASIIGWISIKAREREDTVISALWAAGMAVGILFFVKTPGYNQELMSYLFGNLLMVSRSDLWLIGVMDAVVLTLVILFYNKFLLVCFDEEFARVRRINAERYYLLLLVLVSLTIVLLVSIVGIILVIALITLPAAVAAIMARSMWKIMVIASALTLLFTTGGIALSYDPDLPTGAVIIVLASSVYLIAAFVRRLRGT